MTGAVRINPMRWQFACHMYPIQTVRRGVVHSLERTLRGVLLLDAVRWIMLLVERAQNPNQLTWVSQNTMTLENDYLAIGNVRVEELQAENDN